MPRLNPDERNQAVGALRAGFSTRQVANRLNCHHSTIVRLNQRFVATNSVADRPRSGPPRVTTTQKDRFINLEHLRDRFRTATRTATETPGRHRPRVSAQTVRRGLRENHLKNRRPYKGPVLTQRHKLQRLDWARRHLQWTTLEYSLVFG